MSSPAQPTASPSAPEVAPILFAAGKPPAANAGTDGRAAAAAGVVPFLPAVALLVLWLLWVPASGAYYAAAWYPSGLAVISLLALTMALRRRIMPAAAAARWALGSFGALVAINYLSIAWSRSPGDALDAANLLLLYLCAGWVISLLPWTTRSLGVMLGVVAISIAAFCAGGLIGALSASHLDPFFVQLRYSRPLNYPNATAALAVFGLWPALMIAARRGAPWWLGGAFLGVATFLADFSLLPQSRAALLGLIVVTPLLLIAARSRIRLLLGLLVVGASLAFSIPRTVAVDDAINAGRRVDALLHQSALVMLLCALAAAVLGALVGWLEAHYARSTAPVRLPRGRRATAILGAALAALIATAAIVAVPKVSHLAHTVVSSGRTDAATGATRLVSASPEERFDYARVAVDLFAQHPVGGVGAGNFGIHYDALRRFPKHSRYTHNLTLRVLSETGVLGLLPFLVLLAVLVTGLVRAARRVPKARDWCAAVFAVAVYFLLHSSLDWLDEYPALAVLVLALVLAGSSLSRSLGRSPDPLEGERGRWRVARRGAVGGLAAAVLLGGTIALGLPYLSQRYVQRASREFFTRPAAAFDDLHRAHSLNPLAVDPLLTEATVDLQLGYNERAEAKLREALRLQNDWYSHVELALLQADAGQREAALQQLDVAARLDVKDPLIADVRRIIARGGKMTPAQLSALLRVDSGNLFTKEGIR